MAEIIIREVQIGPCRLIQGDCLEVVTTLRGTDLFITSPPYNLGTTTGGGFPSLGHYSDVSGYSSRGGGGKWIAASKAGGIGHGYESHHDSMPHAEYVEWQKCVLSECFDSLSDSGAIFYNHKPRILGGRCVTPLEYIPNLPVRQIIIWARAGGINFSPAFYLPTHEWITVIAKDAWRLKSKGASGVGDVWRIPQESGSWHPCPFPIAIPQTILETTQFGSVCDPFMGSGTVGKACINANRPFVGIEKSPEYFEQTVKEIQRAWDLKCSELPFEEPKQLTQRELLSEGLV